MKETSYITSSFEKSTSTSPQHTVNYTSRELNEEKVLIVAIRYIISEDIVQFIYIVIVIIQQKIN